MISREPDDCLIVLVRAAMLPSSCQKNAQPYSSLHAMSGMIERSSLTTEFSNAPWARKVLALICNHPASDTVSQAKQLTPCFN